MNDYTKLPGSHPAWIRELFPMEKTQKLDAQTTMAFFQGNDGVDVLIAEGGVSSSGELVKFVARHLLKGYSTPDVFHNLSAGCTAVQVPNRTGEGYLFGRNYDFEPHTMLILKMKPDNGYASVSSVDTTFITNAFGKAGPLLPAGLIKRLGMFLPVDGMNEKGLAISVNMIADDEALVDQRRGKPNHIITTLIRTLLDKAANVEEAVQILENSDMHTWTGFFFHLAIADAAGRSIAAEYIDNQLVILDTPVVTNFYLQPGPKYGIGTEQSHIRYDWMTAHLKEHPALSPDELRDAMHTVAKSSFPDDFHTTEWTVIYDQQALTATYYRQEDYRNGWRVSLK